VPDSGTTSSRTSVPRPRLCRRSSVSQSAHSRPALNRPRGIRDERGNAHGLGTSVSEGPDSAFNRLIWPSISSLRVEGWALASDSQTSLISNARNAHRHEPAGACGQPRRISFRAGRRTSPAETASMPAAPRATGPHATSSLRAIAAELKPPGSLAEWPAGTASRRV